MSFQTQNQNFRRDLTTLYNKNHQLAHHLC